MNLITRAGLAGIAIALALPIASANAEIGDGAYQDIGQHISGVTRDLGASHAVRPVLSRKAVRGSRSSRNHGARHAPMPAFDPYALDNPHVSR